MSRLFFLILPAAILGSSEIPQTRPVPFATLYDQAMEKLLQLNATVESEFAVSKIHFSAVRAEFNQNADKAHAEGEAEIHEEANRVNEQITTARNAAESAGVNIDVCLDTHEIYLSHLPDIIFGDLLWCINEKKLRVLAKTDEYARWLEWSIGNALSDLYNQLISCSSGSIICVTPVASQIDEAFVTLPEIIQARMQAAIDYAERITASVEECVDEAIFIYVNSVNPIVEDIENCVIRLMT